MPVIPMNVPCTIARVTSHSAFGEPKLDVVKKTVCAVLKLGQSRTKTTTRATASASQGHADETTADIRVLLPKATTVLIDDIITVHGLAGRVSGTRLRLTVLGKPDHIEVEATIE